MSSTRFISGRRGAVAIEFALIGLPLVILLIGIVEFGRGLHARNALNDAVDRAQRALLIDAAASAASLEEEVRRAFNAGPDEDLTVAVAAEDQAGRAYRRVTAAFEMRLLLPTPIGRSVTVVADRRVVSNE
ncbi:MAG: TadE/TadG family type IV pilus assembly protein [Pseudomonadota bacterium]